MVWSRHNLFSSQKWSCWRVVGPIHQLASTKSSIGLPLGKRDRRSLHFRNKEDNCQVWKHRAQSKSRWRLSFNGWICYTILAFRARKNGKQRTSRRLRKTNFSFPLQQEESFSHLLPRKRGIVSQQILTFRSWTLQPKSSEKKQFHQQN